MGIGSQLFTTAISVIAINGLLAEEQRITSTEEAKGLVEKGELTAIGNLSREIGQAWASTRRATYAGAMQTLCLGVHASEKKGKAEYLLFQNLTSEVLAMERSSDEGMSRVLYGQAEVVRVLLLPNASATGPLMDWEKNITERTTAAERARLRERSTRLVVLFHRRLRDGLIVGYKDKPVHWKVRVPNVGDPNEVLGPVGGAPSAIKDPVKRKAYEEAIAENCRNIIENNDQQAFAELSKEFGDKIETYFIAAYSRPPIDYYELNEFLLLDGLGEEVRARIMKGVASSSKEGMIPTWLLGSSAHGQ